MSYEKYIRRIQVDGLHHQFDVNLELDPGLNILYGKNGRGKTTILHLLANALELDFRRFAYLQFHRIKIETSCGDSLLLLKEGSDNTIRIFINDSATSFSEGSPVLSDAERAALKEILGGRPTYLPAFRSILERARSDAGYYRHSATDRRESDFDEIFERELATLKENNQTASKSVYDRSLHEEAHNTAQKTILCRQWFGRFVPIIRYPSVADVNDALTSEWNLAHIEVSRREQRMFEEMIVRVFKMIAAADRTVKTESNQSLLASIEELLKDPESQLATSESSGIYANIRDAIRPIGQSNPALEGVDSGLLDMYRQALEERNEQRRIAFQASREFEASVNKFLDGKRLKVGRTAVTNPRVRSAITITTEGGLSYGLSALSSGERQILTMLYSASRTKSLSGIFLIDEPELSLHIDWQRIVLQELSSQAQGRQIIACTHSPEVGADHLSSTKDFEPRISQDRQDSLFSDEEF